MTGVIQPRYVRAALVVVPSPGLDLGPGVGHGQEPRYVQALVAKATVERLYKGVVGGLARSTEVQRHAVLVRPTVECFRVESGPLSTRMVLGTPRINEIRAIASTTCSP